MNVRDSKPISLVPTAPLREAVQVINEKSSTLAIVVTKEGALLGTITDGDVRRGLLRGLTLENSVSEVMNPSPVALPIGTSREGLLRVMRAKGVSQILLLSASGKVEGFSLQSDLVETPYRIDLPVVILAGGYGKRLFPLTEGIPKPMLPVGGQPLLELMIRRMAEQGFYNFYLAVHYLNNIIKNHLKDGSQFGVNIRYLDEKIPLGTAGALRLVRGDLNGSFLVINGDLITSIKIDHLIQFHKSEKNEITSAIKEYAITVPFGVVKLEGARITGLEEKPTVRRFVNVGIYAMEPSVLSLLPSDGSINMTDLILLALADHRKVEGFPLHEYWQDIGRPEDYHRANDQWVADHDERRDAS